MPQAVGCAMFLHGMRTTGAQGVFWGCRKNTCVFQVFVETGILNAMTQEECSYEDRFSLFVRRWNRLTRTVRWRVKRAMRLRRRLLVEICWRLGDEVMALPVYEALKKQYPDIILSVWCNYPDLLQDNPFVDEINRMDILPDRYIFLRYASRTVYRAEAYAWAAGVPVPLSLPRLYYTDWSCRFVQELGIGTSASSPWVAVSTGTSWRIKEWRREHWEWLCTLFRDRGIRVVQLGTSEPVLEGVVDLVGKTTVREAACVLRSVNVFVGCDSGLMHLARAVGTPAVALFGPTDPDILIRKDPGFFPVRAECECLGCWNRKLSKNPGECIRDQPSCLDTIQPEKVAELVYRVLSESKG